MGELQSNILQDPRKILSDLELIVAQKSRISGRVLDTLVERAAKMAQSDKIKPGSREWDRITRFFARERKLEDAGKRLHLEKIKILLSVLAPQVATAVQVNIDTSQASETDEVLHDFIARTAAETRTILDAYGRADTGDAASQRTDSDGSGGHGEGGSDAPA